MNIHKFHACNSSSRPDTINKGAKEKKERENREKGALSRLEAQVFSSILKGGKQVA